MTAVSARRAAGLAPAPELFGFDHVEWWVGNARHAAQFFASGFGFTIEAYAGPETGSRDRMSYALRQGEVCFVVTSPLDGASEIAEHVRRHGDGVRVVAYRVADAREAHARAVARGGKSAQEPREHHDDHGVAVVGAIHTYGDTVHALVDRTDYHGVFLPGFEPAPQSPAVGTPVGLTRFDHVVANVEDGRLANWVAWYERVWGLGQLQHFGEEAISTEFSALRSTVVWNGGNVVQPINEPAEGLRKSQIAEYLDYYGSPGVQHLALRTDDIVATVSALRERGIRLLHVPADYYEEAPRRMASLDVALPWEQLAELGILFDRDESGYLLQVFTESVASRPTAFLEIIQRQGARGFGEGNFKALFVSIEAEQARRGNL
ncbi:MAG: 4-hydroxyphenylpyruvate dioxygenase [Acidimicrobiia bacterium]